MINIKSTQFFSFKKTLKKLDGSKKPRDVVEPILGQERDLKKCVAEYIRNRKNLELIKKHRFGQDISKELKNCYDQMPAGIKKEVDVFHQKLLSEAKICPYCLISEPDSCDHYLPKEDFPEFSFFIYNLIPCCSNCNRRKGVKLSDNGKRLFINPIFDDVDSGFIDVEISLDELTVSFYSKDGLGLFTPNSHVKNLDLIRRFNDQGVSVLSRVLGYIEETPSLKSLDIFKEEMARQFRISRKVYGDNHYETLIYKKLSVFGHDLT